MKGSQQSYRKTEAHGLHTLGSRLSRRSRLKDIRRQRKDHVGLGNSTLTANGGPGCMNITVYSSPRDLFVANMTMASTTVTGVPEARDQEAQDAEVSGVGAVA